MSLKSSFARALAIVAGIPSVLASAVNAMAALRAGYDAEIEKLREQINNAESVSDIDLSGLEAASSAAESAEADFAKAIAANTPASAEVHTDDTVQGGTGTAPVDAGSGTTAGTVVDPAAVDTSEVVAAVTDPAPEGAQD